MNRSTYWLISSVLVCVACGGQSSSTAGGSSGQGNMVGGNSNSGGNAATIGGQSTRGGNSANTGGSGVGLGGTQSAGGAPGAGGTVDCGCVRGAYIPVCGNNGMTYDATCGDSCVPVPIACRGQCPCSSGAGGNSSTGGNTGSVACGSNVCLAGQHCCGPSCGICSVGAVCPAIACAVGGSTGNGGATSGGGAVSTGGSTSATACDSTCTTSGFTCCSSACRNVTNDPFNCGQCGNVCPSASPICQNNQCVALACTAELGPPGTVCCGQTWCATGQLCCEQQGPVAGATPMCLTTTDGTCPRGCKLCVCANPDTPIETPDGPKAISTLRVGDLVYSVDHEQVAPVRIAETKRRPAIGHVVPQVLLSNGQVLQISAGHPTADGRTFGDLRAGEKLGSLRIKSVELVTYEHEFTYDILPASDTGYYFAGGALIGNTIAPMSNMLACKVPDALQR